MKNEITTFNDAVNFLTSKGFDVIGASEHGITLVIGAGGESELTASELIELANAVTF